MQIEVCSFYNYVSELQQLKYRMPFQVAKGQLKVCIQFYHVADLILEENDNLSRFSSCPVVFERYRFPLQVRCFQRIYCIILVYLMIHKRIWVLRQLEKMLRYLKNVNSFTIQFVNMHEYVHECEFVELCMHVDICMQVCVYLIYKTIIILSQRQTDRQIF